MYADASGHAVRVPASGRALAATIAAALLALVYVQMAIRPVRSIPDYRQSRAALAATPREDREGVFAAFGSHSAGFRLARTIVRPDDRFVLIVRDPASDGAGLRLGAGYYLYPARAVARPELAGVAIVVGEQALLPPGFEQVAVVDSVRVGRRR